MTETTAKKGMVKYKTGFSKNDFDYDFLSQVNYDESRKLVNVIEALFGKIDKLENLVKELSIQHKDRIDQLEKEYNERLERIEKAFEQNIKEWLSV